MTIFVSIVIIALIWVGRYIVNAVNYEARMDQIAQLFINAIRDRQRIINMVIVPDGRRRRFNVNFWVEGRRGPRFHRADEYIEMTLSIYEILIFNEMFSTFRKVAASAKAYEYWLNLVNGTRYNKVMGKANPIRLRYADKGIAIRVANLDSKIRTATGYTTKVD